MISAEVMQFGHIRKFLVNSLGVVLQDCGAEVRQLRAHPDRGTTYLPETPSALVNADY